MVGLSVEALDPPPDILYADWPLAVTTNATLWSGLGVPEN